MGRGGGGGAKGDEDEGGIEVINDASSSSTARDAHLAEAGQRTASASQTLVGLESPWILDIHEEIHAGSMISHRLDDDVNHGGKPCCALGISSDGKRPSPTFQKRGGICHGAHLCWSASNAIPTARNDISEVDLDMHSVRCAVSQHALPPLPLPPCKEHAARRVAQFKSVDVPWYLASRACTASLLRGPLSRQVSVCAAH